MSLLKRWIEAGKNATPGPWQQAGACVRDSSAFLVAHVTSRKIEIDAEFIALSRSMPEKVEAFVKAVDELINKPYDSVDEAYAVYIEVKEALKELDGDE